MWLYEENGTELFDRMREKIKFENKKVKNKCESDDWVIQLLCNGRSVIDIWYSSGRCGACYYHSSLSTVLLDLVEINNFFK